MATLRCNESLAFRAKSERGEWEAREGGFDGALLSSARRQKGEDKGEVVFFFSFSFRGRTKRITKMAKTRKTEES